MKAYTSIHILNVGAGSCLVLDSPSGRRSMVDINDGGELRHADQGAPLSALIRQLGASVFGGKLTDPVRWYKDRFGKELFRFILTHPDADHMAGIRRILRGELAVKVIWDLPHHRTHSDPADFRNEAAYRDWDCYDVWRSGGDNEKASPNSAHPMRGSSARYWSDDGIEILSPSQTLVRAADKQNAYNNASYVLRITHASSSILLPGDIEETAWNDLTDSGLLERTNILLAAHHGRRSGYSATAMGVLQPDVVITSTAQLADKQDASDLYKKQCPHVFSTRDHGDISVKMHDSGDVHVSNAKGKTLLKLRGDASKVAVGDWREQFQRLWFG